MSEQDDPLDAIIADYLQQVEAGEVPEREALLAQHPEYAERLRAFFADCDRLDRQAADLRLSNDPNRTTDQVSPPSANATGLAGLPRVRYFGDYELLEVIARGGMGVVYKARQVSLNRLVALKMILKGELAGERDVARFRAEAEAAANLDHAHIVPIYEVGEHEGQQYYAMRNVEGTSLNRHPRADVRKEAELVATIARAVHYAHQHGILHRDVKPSNILVDSAGTPFVTDFGLAKRVDADRSLTESGALVGTPRYMAPEQAAGRRDLTVAADVYSLGVVLYERLTGRPPFDGESALEILRRVREAEPRRPTSIIQGLNRDLETICLKCLEKEPAKRYGSAETLADDLDRWLRGEPILARPVGQVERVWRWSRRNQTASILLATVVLALLTGTIVSWTFAVRAAAGTERAERAADDAKAAAAREAEEKRLGRYNLYIAKIRLAQSAWRAGNFQRTVQLLQETRPAEGETDHRNFEWYYLWRLTNSHLSEFVGHSDPVNRLIFSPNNQFLVSDSTNFQGHAGGIRVWALATGEVVFSLPSNDQQWDSAIALSPDSRLLARTAMAGATNRAVEIWDINTHQKKQTFQRRDVALALAFTPDGKALAVGHSTLVADSNSGVTISDLASKREILSLEGTYGSIVYDIAYDRLGKKVAVAGNNSNVNVCDATTGQVLVKLKHSGHSVTRVSWIPDGNQLATIDQDTVRIWDTSNGTELFALRGHVGTINSIAYSPDGSRIASAGVDQLVKVWSVADRRELMTIKGHSRSVQSVAFSPDGKWLASGGRDKIIKLWDATRPQECRIVEGRGPIVVSPDGARFVTEDSLDDAPRAIRNFSDGRIVEMTPSVRGSLAFVKGGHLVLLSPFDAAHPELPPTLSDVETGKRIIKLNIKLNSVRRADKVRFSPDGKLIATGDNDGYLKIWNLKGDVLASSKAHDEEVWGVAFSPDGQRLASIGLEGSLKIWDVPSGHKLLDLTVLKQPVVCFSPSGRLLAVAGTANDGNGTVTVYDSHTGRSIHALRGHTDSISSLAFSPDELRLASSDALFGAGIRKQSTIKVWELRTGQDILELVGDEKQSAAGSYQSLVFDRDGKWLAAAGLSTVRIWETGKR